LVQSGWWVVQDRDAIEMPGVGFCETPTVEGLQNAFEGVQTVRSERQLTGEVLFYSILDFVNTISDALDWPDLAALFVKRIGNFDKLGLASA
jgi:hypothetical protein